MGDVGKLLLIAGMAIALVGGLLIIGGRFGIGGLPGDVSVSRGSFTFVFPVVTCIVLSLILTIILSVFFRP